MLVAIGRTEKQNEKPQVAKRSGLFLDRSPEATSKAGAMFRSHAVEADHQNEGRVPCAVSS